MRVITNRCLVLKVVYSSKFVMCVLVNGRPQKELANGVVKIPFGEYALRFRNKHSNRRALVKIFIDGENVSGDGYIIPANSFIDIERWSEKAVKFKFVPLDSEEAIDFGKNGPNPDKVKGTIEARFHLEKEQPTYKPLPVEHHHHHHHYPRPTPVWPTPYWYGLGSNTSVTINTNDQCSVSYSSSDPDIATFKRISIPLERRSRERTVAPEATKTCSMGDAISGLATNCCVGPSQVNWSCESPAPPVTEATPAMDGCTVEGNMSNQRFTTVTFHAEEDYVSLKLFLQGVEETSRPQPAAQPRETVKSRKLREIEEENQRLKELLKQKEQEDAEAAELAKLEAENRRLREALGKSPAEG